MDPAVYDRMAAHEDRHGWFVARRRCAGDLTLNEVIVFLAVESADALHLYGFQVVVMVVRRIAFALGKCRAFISFGAHALPQME